jgi:hypothetical protein
MMGLDLSRLSLACPLEIMKFTLTYEGELPASGNKPKPAHVWEIRRAIHPQIIDLFDTHPVMNEVVADEAVFPSINIHGWLFRPVVRKHLKMICSLDVLFLRKMEHEGLVHQGGDIDNRLKTLFDGLRMPDKGDAVPSAQDVGEQPLATLLESDSLINGFSVRADKLLDCRSTSKHWVKLVIGVQVSVTSVTLRNLSFLGD